MDYSIFFIKFFGYFYFLIGFCFIISKKARENMPAQTKSSPFLMALFCLLMGLPVVILHNIWEFSVVGFITLMGWGALVKAVVLLAFPDLIFSKLDNRSDNLLKIRAWVAFIFGLGLMYCGYYPYW